jgi:hypothetical protein
MVGFVVFGLLRTLFNKMKLDNENAIGKEFEPQSSFSDSIFLSKV